MRVFAVDWSGAASGASSRIWMAEVRDGRLVRLESGRSRAEIAAELVRLAESEEELVVGFDFAFSFPEWFLRQEGVADAHALWTRVEERGEQWLQACDPPFWGRPGRTKPDHEEFRATELDVQERYSAQPKSVFQIGGAGAVGTGSIRGMPILAELGRNGFSIWPFDQPRFPLVVEIYPRLLTGEVIKSDPSARSNYLADGYPELDEEQRAVAASTEDAFDAAVSAVLMWRHREEFRSLRPASDPAERLEGRIWYPEHPAEEKAERRQRDSSKTRVAPIMDQVSGTGADWLRRLLKLPQHGFEGASVDARLSLEVMVSAWEPKEQPLQPPVGLLSWLIRNLEVRPKESDTSDAAERRRKLCDRNPDTIREALQLLRTTGGSRSWPILEGTTYPDVFIETRDAVVVIEGKRTESGPTTGTTWMPVRHQMLRHMDAAWEIRGARRVYGFFVVEADADDGAVPESWIAAAADTVSEKTLRRSLPHRSAEETEGIANGFLGVTTWQAVCSEFGIDPGTLPDTT